MQSLLAQNFFDYEVILVDDGSGDRSFEICNDYAAKDSRVRVLHQVNGGVSSARNLGIDNSNGEWIAFVDSDDAVTPEYLSSLYIGVLDNKNSFVFGGVGYTDANGRIIQNINFERRIYDREQFSLLSNQLEICKYGFPVAKLYNRELLNSHNIRFNTMISFSEDMLFMYQYLDVCDAVSMFESAEYLYYQREQDCLSSRLNSFESEYEMFSKLREVVERNSKCWGITTQSGLSQTVSRYLFRAILSCYYRRTYKTRAKRVKLLGMIAVEHSDYIYQYNSPLIYNKLITFWLIRRFYYTLDVILSLLIRK